MLPKLYKSVPCYDYVVLNSLELVKSAKALNAKLFSLTRLQLLSALYLLGGEYALYRDLKASLALDDGVLISNLLALKEMGCIEKKEVQVGKKKMDAYQINDEGRAAFEKTRDWLSLFARENGAVLK